MARKIVIHQAVYYGLGILLMKSVSLIMLPILTHYFTPAEYGALELMLSPVMPDKIRRGSVLALCQQRVKQV